jgi:hypothetical protein
MRPQRKSEFLNNTVYYFKVPEAKRATARCLARQGTDRTGAIICIHGRKYILIKLGFGLGPDFTSPSVRLSPDEQLGDICVGLSDMGRRSGERWGVRINDYW